MGRTPCCQKAEVKKGPWSIHEDQILMNYIALHGHPNWRALPKQAGLKRCGKSCRLRWFNYLKPDIKRGNFTKEEEDAIINLHQLLGNKWSAIAARLPGRTDNEIKNVWHTHLKKRLMMNKDDDDDHDHGKEQQPPTSSSSSEANSSSSTAPTKSTVNDDDDTIHITNNSDVDNDDGGIITFPEIDHNFLSQVLFSDDDQYSDDLISTTTTTTTTTSSCDDIINDHPFACSLLSPAHVQDEYSSSDTDHYFWFNLYTAAAAADAAADAIISDDYSIQSLPDISFDSLIDPPII